MNDTLIKGQTSSSFSLLNKMLFYSVSYHNCVWSSLNIFDISEKRPAH